MKLGLVAVALGAAAVAAVWIFARKRGPIGAAPTGDSRPLTLKERQELPGFSGRIATEESDPPQEYVVELFSNEAAPVARNLVLKVHNLSPFGTGNGDGTHFRAELAATSATRVKVTTGIKGSPIFAPALWRSTLIEEDSGAQLDEVTRIGV